MHYTYLPLLHFLIKRSKLFLFWVECCMYWLFIQVGRIPFNQQISNFESTLNQLRSNNGDADVGEALAKSIFFVGMGSNDYLNNYLMPNYNTKNQYNAQQYATLLTQQYNQQLTVRLSFYLIFFSSYNFIFPYFSYSTNLLKILCFFPQYSNIPSSFSPMSLL